MDIYSEVCYKTLINHEPLNLISMKKSLFLFLLIMLPTATAIATELQQPIMITMNVVNHVKKNVFLSLKRYSGYRLKDVFNLEQDLKKKDYYNGKLLFIMPIGQTTVMDIVYKLGVREEDKNILCRLKIDSLDSNSAVITQIEAYNHSSIKCEYSGDPADNTATITLRDQ